MKFSLAIFRKTHPNLIYSSFFNDCLLTLFGGTFMERAFSIFSPAWLMTKVASEQKTLFPSASFLLYDHCASPPLESFLRLEVPP